MWQLRGLLLIQMAYILSASFAWSPVAISQAPVAAALIGLSLTGLTGLTFLVFPHLRSPLALEAASCAITVLGAGVILISQVLNPAASFSGAIYEVVLIMLIALVVPWRVAIYRVWSVLIGFLGFAGMLYSHAPPPQMAAFSVAFASSLLLANVASALMWNTRVERFEGRNRLRALQGALRRAALTDAVTGIKNRHALDAYLDHLTARSGGGLTLAIVDIDHFKGINDHYGHLAGDDILRTVALTLAHATRANDHFYRYGGEEFLVAFEDMSLSDAQVVANRMRLGLAELQLSNPASESGALTISIGAAELALPARLEAIIATIDLADRRLYMAKQTGRNRVVVNDDMGEPLAAESAEAFSPSLARAL